MDERSRITNGRFLHTLDNWTASNASYSAGDGDDHYGVAVLATGGGFVEQPFVVDTARRYSLHIAVKPVGSALSGSQATLRITDGSGNTVVTQNLSGAADTWTVSTSTFGLASGTTYRLRITNASAAGNVKIDDVWLWWVPITRAQLADQVNTKLARLASQRSLSTTASGSTTEGDYTNAVDAGLRTAGALDPETDLPDVRYLSAAQVDTALDAIEQEMLERLYRDYAVDVDIAVGPRRESLSQTAAAIAKLTAAGGGAPSANRVVTRKLFRETNDYDFT